jgi:hypothetical protein
VGGAGLSSLLGDQQSPRDTSLGQCFAKGSVDPRSIAPLDLRKRHDSLVQFGWDDQIAIERLVCPFPPLVGGVVRLNASVTRPIAGRVRFFTYASFAISEVTARRMNDDLR